MILITGITGLVGSFIARDLLKSGFKIKGVFRNQSDWSLVNDIRNQIEWVEGDLLDVCWLQEIMENVDYVIHSAAVVSYWPLRFQEMYMVNVLSTINLVNISIKNNVKGFLFISSVAALGKPKEGELVFENTEWSDGDAVSYYAKTKYWSELEVWRGAEEGLKVSIISPSVILGIGNDTKSSTRLFKYVKDENLFYRNGYLNYIDIRDLSDIVILILTKKHFFNQKYILSSGCISYKLFFENIATNLGVKPPKYLAPKFIVELLWRYEYIKSIITKKEPLITSETSKLAVKKYVYKSNKIQNEFNFTFRDLNDSIKWVIDGLYKNR